MKTSLLFLGLLFFLTIFVGPASAQQTSQIVPPPPNGEAPYAVPPQVPAGTAPMMQMPPPGYGAPDPSMYQGQPGPPQQFVQWGPPPAGIQGNAMQGPPMGQPPQGYPPQGYGAPGPDPGMMQAPPRMSAYEQQEAALREAQMVSQLEDVKQQKEMEESFRNGVLAEFDDNSKTGGTDDGFNGDQSKLKTGVKKTKTALKTGMKWCAPTASYIGTFFILRGMTGGF
jgi:hypothetical protein